MTFTYIWNFRPIPSVNQKLFAISHIFHTFFTPFWARSSQKRCEITLLSPNNLTYLLLATISSWYLLIGPICPTRWHWCVISAVLTSNYVWNFIPKQWVILKLKFFYVPVAHHPPPATRQYWRGISAVLASNYVWNFSPKYWLLLNLEFFFRNSTGGKLNRPTDKY